MTAKDKDGSSSEFSRDRRDDLRDRRHIPLDEPAEADRQWDEMLPLERELEDVGRLERADLARLRDAADAPLGRAERAFEQRLRSEQHPSRWRGMQIGRWWWASLAAAAAVLAFFVLRTDQEEGSDPRTVMGNRVRLVEPARGIVRYGYFEVELRTPVPENRGLATVFTVYDRSDADAWEPLLTHEVSGTRWELTETQEAALPDEVRVTADVWIGSGTRTSLGSDEASYSRQRD